MKTTIDLPDEVFRKSKAAAAMRGESLKDFVADSLRARLEPTGPVERSASGWRRVFGQARSEEVAEVDAVVAEDLGVVDPESWK